MARWNVGDYDEISFVLENKTLRLQTLKTSAATYFLGDFQVPADIIVIHPPFIRQLALMAHRTF